MTYSADRVINGIMKYADNEIMVKLPTTGKWIFGTAFNLAQNKIDDLIIELQKNPISKMLGVVDADGNIEVDNLVEALKQSADKYGVISIDVPLVGNMTFSTNDISSMRNYIV